MSACRQALDSASDIKSGGNYVIISDNEQSALTMSGHLVAVNADINIVIVGPLQEQQLVDTGSHITLCSANLSDQVTMSAQFAHIRRDLGEISGLIFCPGSPQVKALLLSASLIGRECIDFCLVVSVESAEQPFLAAQLFTNSFVQRQHHQGNEHWISAVFPDSDAVEDSALFVRLFTRQNPAQLFYKA
jgi:hypothetical protein